MNSNDEKLLREFVRKTFVKKMLQEQKKQFLQEQQVRKFVRSLISESMEEKRNIIISEAKDMANPHPNTGINKLRDAIRKAKPSIKTKFQQLTTSKEQRESFSNHLLAAFVRFFDQMDALSAQAEESEVEKVDAELGADLGGESSELEAPPSDDELEAELEDELGQDIQLENILREIDIDVEGDPEEMDVVSGDIQDEKESTKNKNMSQVEKDVEKKKSQDKEREEFGAGLDGDTTGRNQAFDAFNLVQSYFSDNYLDLANDEDRQMFKKWGLYNLKLLLDSYEEELSAQPEQPNIENPQ